MRAVLVGVANILTEQSCQVAFGNCDDVIPELTPATPLCSAKIKNQYPIAMSQCYIRPRFCAARIFAEHRADPRSPSAW